MKIEFDASFLKGLKKIKDGSVHSKIEQVLLECEALTQIEKIRNCKKLVGFENYFRIRLGSYRIGFERKDGQTIRFITVAHRKDIYKIFP